MELELSRAGMSVANFVLDSIGSGFAVVHFQNGRQLVEAGRMEQRGRRATVGERNMGTVGERNKERRQRMERATRLAHKV